MPNIPFRPRIIDRLMLRTLRKTLPRNQRRGFDLTLADLLQNEKPFLTDPTTAGHILFAAAVLSLYRQLRQLGHGDGAARDLIGQRLRRMGRRTTALFMALTLGRARDPLQALRAYSRDRMQRAYGPSFDIRDADIDKEGGFVSEVFVCGYRSFLARHGALALAPVLCEWDRVWIDALPGPIAFARPTTLAEGGASCRFEFRRK